MNSAGRWPPAKATRNPHGVEEKEVLFFEGKFPQLHSISFFVSHSLHFHPTPFYSSSRPTFSRSFSSFSQTLHISLSAAIRTENCFSLQLLRILPAFPQSQKRLAFFCSFRAFLLSSPIACIGAWFVSHREFRSPMPKSTTWSRP